MTPEAKVKAWVKTWLDREMPGHWRYSPRGGPFAAAGAADLFLLWNGVFGALEIKAENGSLTDLQRASLRSVDRAGGVAAVVRGRDEARMMAFKSAMEAKCRISQ